MKKFAIQHTPVEGKERMVQYPAPSIDAVADQILNSHICTEIERTGDYRR